MASEAAAPRRWWAPRAWLADGWHEHVLLEAGADGRWLAVTPGVHAAPADTAVLAGPVLPGLVDAHGHAFQRAFAGLAERRDGEHDDFWSWRDRMYAVALRVSPDDLRAIAAHLYVELVRGGYTHVCEFHYLHHAPDGTRYADPMTLSWALADAAADAGIGLTLLPVLYQRAGFAQPQLRPDQRRFATGADDVLAMQRAAAASGRPLLNAGVALHSLRACTPEAIARVVERCGDVPVHVHAAEQTAEVDDCLAATGQRPVQWLAQRGGLDARWQVVHATHVTRAEIDAVARAGAGIVLCPSTEANLGDGLTDLPAWLDAGVPVAIGSDSHVTRGWREELRLADYGQRLVQRRRNVCAAPSAGEPSTAARLWRSALAGGGRAAGFARWGLQAGARADLLVVDTHDASLLGVPAAQLLDALVFSSPGRPWRDVMIAGRWVVQSHRHAGSDSIARAFAQRVEALWTA